MTEIDSTRPIRRALLSVSDKRGLVDLAGVLADRGVHLLASGGTRSILLDAGIAVTEVAEYTGHPEILDGRVKTLHPKLHGGILARRDVEEDLAALQAHGIGEIDLVVVNLYPFEATIARPGVSFAEAIENIDVGGPTLIRAAAKNHAFVAVLTDPDQYPRFLEAYAETGGTTLAYRLDLARDVFAATERYDGLISDYLTKAEGDLPVFPDRIRPEFVLRTELRYGENPHQRAAFYVDPGGESPSLARSKILHGKELSYNNLLDLDSALRVARGFASPFSVILKHNNPCGAATAATLAGSFELAYEGDPISAFGGIVGVNRPLDLETAERLCEPGRFIEAILAPSFNPDAFQLLTTRPSWKNSVRLVSLGATLDPDHSRPEGMDLRRIEGGLLVQDWDLLTEGRGGWNVATRRGPTSEEEISLDFAWRICQAVKSNGIVLVRGTQLVGVGAGQMSRLDSVRIAVEKAGERARGAVLASDAFFPFRDGPDLAIEAGVTALIQPGGSRRDADSIAACDAAGLSMIFTGRRHFRH